MDEKFDEDPVEGGGGGHHDLETSHIPLLNREDDKADEEGNDLMA